MKRWSISVTCFLVVLLLALPAAVVAMPLLGQFAGPDRLPNGLELTNFTVQGPTPLKTGNQVLVTFRLTNKGETQIQLDSRYGAFVGCRWNSTSDQNNRDFGHAYKGKVLMPSVSIVVQARVTVANAGTWRFWPAFHAGGNWGPFRWHEIVVQVEQGPPPGQKPPKANPTDAIGAPADVGEILTFDNVTDRR